MGKRGVRHMGKRGLEWGKYLQRDPDIVRRVERRHRVHDDLDLDEELGAEVVGAHDVQLRALVVRRREVAQPLQEVGVGASTDERIELLLCGDGPRKQE